MLSVVLCCVLFGWWSCWRHGVGAANSGTLPALYTPSCKGARQIHEGTAQFCSMVDWVSGNLYNSSTFSVFDSGTALDLDQQNAVAENFARSIVSSSSSASITCRAAINRLACVTAFPYCGAQGASVSSISYTPPCRLQCEQANRICGPTVYNTRRAVSIDCSSLPEAKNCMMTIPDGRFLLNPEQGPYDGVAVVYGVTLALWTCLTVYYAVSIDVLHEKDALPLSKSSAVLPFVRMVLAAILLVFWLDCAGLGDMCRTSFASALYVLFPFVESIQMFLFLAAARGWGTTQANLSLFTWRMHILLSFGFYVVLTMLTGTMKVAGTDWIVYTLCTYGTMYAVIVRAACREMAVLQGQVDRLGPWTSRVAAEPLRAKHASFRWFLLLVLAEIALEVLCRCLLASHAVSYLTLSVLYESVSLVLLVAIGACFAPRAYSPFHFMVPTSLEYVVAGADGQGDGEGDDGQRLGEADELEDQRAVRVRRVLSRNTHAREAEEDVAALERLRLARAQRPSPIVVTYLRGAPWWQGGDSRRPGGALENPSDGREVGLESRALLGGEGVGAEEDGGVELAPFQQESTSVAAPGINTVAGSVDLARQLGSAFRTSRASMRGQEWGLGGDHSLPAATTAWDEAGSAARRGTGNRGARVVALTCPGPAIEDYEVALAVQHFPTR